MAVFVAVDRDLPPDSSQPAVDWLRQISSNRTICANLCIKKHSRVLFYAQISTPETYFVVKVLCGSPAGCVFGAIVTGDFAEA